MTRREEELECALRIANQVLHEASNEWARCRLAFAVEDGRRERCREWQDRLYRAHQLCEAAINGTSDEEGGSDGGSCR